MGTYVKKILMTPEYAESILATANVGNRKIAKETVRQYAQDIDSGDFTESWDLIAFDESGNLVNGQHRLSAIVSAGKPIELYAMYGVSERAVEHGDQGKKRSSSNVVHYRYGDDCESLYRCKTTFSIAKRLMATESGHATSTLHSQPSTVFDWIDCHLNVMRLAHYLFCLMHTKGFRTAGVVSALISAVANGVPIHAVECFVRTAENNLCGVGYNHKSALDYARKCLTGGVKYVNERQEDCERALYTFVNNTNTTRKRGSIYPVSKEKLYDLNVKLSEVYENGGN